MHTEQLKRTLYGLHKELARDQTIDTELQALLTTLDDDIQDLLNANSPPLESHGVMDAAESVAARFAVDHPRIEALVRELVATLAKMGV
jgi:hypothetical protein